MPLIGPDRIRVSETEIEELHQTYKTLSHDINALIGDFYSPFEVMHLLGVFQGEAANSFELFCSITRSYLETRFETTFEDIILTLDKLQEELEEANNV